MINNVRCWLILASHSRRVRAYHQSINTYSTLKSVLPSPPNVCIFRPFLQIFGHFMAIFRPFSVSSHCYSRYEKKLQFINNNMLKFILNQRAYGAEWNGYMCIYTFLLIASLKHKTAWPKGSQQAKKVRGFSNYMQKRGSHEPNFIYWKTEKKDEKTLAGTAKLCHFDTYIFDIIYIFHATCSIENLSIQQIAHI